MTWPRFSAFDRIIKSKDYMGACEWSIHNNNNNNNNNNHNNHNVYLINRPY